MSEKDLHGEAKGFPAAPLGCGWARELLTFHQPWGTLSKCASFAVVWRTRKSCFKLLGRAVLQSNQIRTLERACVPGPHPGWGHQAIAPEQVKLSGTKDRRFWDLLASKPPNTGVPNLW